MELGMTEYAIITKDGGLFDYDVVLNRGIGFFVDEEMNKVLSEGGYALTRDAPFDCATGK